MAIARGGPTRSRSESVALGIKEYSIGDTVFHDDYGNRVHVPHNRFPAGTFSSYGPGYGGLVNTNGYAGVANTNHVVSTNAKGLSYVSDSNCN